uniref:VWFD domain-containing protein n=1 Tax=Leptobrachium leishanense TaxID=445787 RepID=A0A8C5MQ65_9ANUR
MLIFPPLFFPVLGKGPYKLVSYLDRSLVLASRISDGSVFPMRTDYLVAGDRATFMLTPGLYKPKAHDRNLVSLELADRPNYFLYLARNDTFMISKWQKNEAFQNRSTFIIHRNSWISGYSAFECFAKTGFFLRLSSSYIYLTRYHHSAAFRLSSLFRLTDSKVKLSPRSSCEWSYDACSSACFRTCRDPEGEHCKEVPRVEGCFPSCPSHMVLDEVTRKCVFLEDCIEPPVAISVLLSTPAPTEQHTLSTAFNVTSPPSISFTSASSMKPDITAAKVSKSSDIITGRPGFVTGVVPHTVMSTNASIATPVSTVALHISQEPTGTLSPVSHSTPTDVFSSRPDAGVSTSSLTPPEETVSTVHVEVKTDTDSSPSHEAERSRITLTPSAVSTERSQLPLTGRVPSTPPVQPITSTEAEGATTRETTSGPSIKSTLMIEEKVSVTMLPSFTKPVTSQFVSGMLTSKRTTFMTPTETTTMSPTTVHTSTIYTASTTETERALVTTPASSVILTTMATITATKTIIPTSEISTEHHTSLETTQVSQTEPQDVQSYSTMTTTYPFSSESTMEELLSTPTMGSTRPSGTTLVTESTLPELNVTISPTSLPFKELVSLETGMTTQISTKALSSQTPAELTSNQTFPTQATQTTKVTEARTTVPETSTTLLSVTSPPPMSKLVSGQTILSTSSEPEITTKVSTAASTIYSLHPILTTESTTSSYPLVSETSVATTSLESITTVPSLTSHPPLLTTQTEIETTKPMEKIQTSGITTNMTTIYTDSAYTAEISHLSTGPGQNVTQVDTTFKASKATTQMTTALLNITGTTSHPFTETLSKTPSTQLTSMEFKTPEVPVTSPHIFNATETLAERISTKHVATETSETTFYTSTFHQFSNVTGSIKSIPYTERTTLPTDVPAIETVQTSAQTTSVKVAPGTTSLEPSTTYSTKNVSMPFLSTTIMYPSTKTSISVSGSTPEGPLADITRTTQMTTQRTYSPFITSLSTAYPAVPSSTTEPLKMLLTTERQTVLTEAVNITRIASPVTVLNTTTTPTGLPTPFPSTVPPSSSETTPPEERSEKLPASTEKVETLFMSSEHTTELKGLSSTEIHKTTAQLISQPSTQSEVVSETLATHQPTPIESVSPRVVGTEETSTSAITITRDTVSGAPKTIFPSTTTHSPQVVTSHTATVAVHSTPTTKYTSERTSSGVTTGLTITHVSKTIEKDTTEVPTTSGQTAEYSLSYGVTEGLTSKPADMITLQTSRHTSRIVNETEGVSKTTQSPHTDAARVTSLTSSVQPFLPTSQEPKLQSSTVTPTKTLTDMTYPRSTIRSTVTESIVSLTTTELETVSDYTKKEDITEEISASSLMPSETATAQTCVPYTENDCIKYICVDGQLIQVNKSLHCPYNATQPSCGLLGFAVQINGDKCCPKWECACRCSIFSDMSFVTFDGRYLALFKEASYILSLTEDESVTVQVSKCKPTNGVNNKNDVTLCLSVLELAHLSNQIIIDRLNRKVAVNARYAWPMVRKYGYKIVDTGNMYLIDTPTNMKIQWFHSTGLMIIESNSTSKPPSMGLCGFCDGNTTNDFILPNGRVLGKSDDAAEFLDSWQVPYTQKYVGKERHQDVNCSVADCSECFGMVLNQAFTSCHPYVSPEAFCELWVQDTEYIEDQCKALTAYASMCHKFNICIEWRSLDYCPFQCPETLRYQSCLPVCDVPRTCQNNEIDLHDTESCSALTEGCVCAQGTLLHRPYSTLCIPEAKCACTDSSGTPRAVGEVWKTSVSGCCMHKCIDNDTIIPVEYGCSDGLDPWCSRHGEVVISVSDNQTCCPRKICVCNQTECDSLVPECGMMEKLSSYYQEDSCCPRYTCECDPEKCETTDQTQRCRDDQTLFVANVNNSCCGKPFCACTVCTNHIPTCRDGEILTVDGNFTEKCCPKYTCVCDSARCPEMTCDPGMSLVEIWSPDSCCPYKTCGNVHFCFVFLYDSIYNFVMHVTPRLICPME